MARRRNALVVASSLLCAVLLTPDASAQEPAAEGRTDPRNQFTLTAHVGGVTAGYARSLRPGTMLGGQLGVGGDISSVMLVGGSHFGEWLAYEERDAAGGEDLFEVGHVGVFVRRTPSERMDYDVGLRGSVFFHWDESDDDPGAGLFVGAYGTAMVGWRNFKVGPRLQVGLFSEGSGTNELGVYLAPITARVALAW